MQPSAKILLNLKGKKSHILWNGTEKYYAKLRSAYNEIYNNKESDYLYFAFITLCASTLEYSLNFTITDYFLNKLGADSYKTYSEVYIGLRMRSKLLMIPFIVSDGKYCINQNHSSFKQLEELISLRNKILHNKESLQEIELSITDFQENDNLILPVSNANFEIEVPDPTNYIDSLTRDKCLVFGTALGDFKRLIMTPSLNRNLSENEMILKL